MKRGARLFLSWHTVRLRTCATSTPSSASYPESNLLASRLIRATWTWPAEATDSWLSRIARSSSPGRQGQDGEAALLEELSQSRTAYVLSITAIQSEMELDSRRFIRCAALLEDL